MKSETDSPLYYEHVATDYGIYLVKSIAVGAILCLDASCVLLRSKLDCSSNPSCYKTKFLISFKLLQDLEGEESSLGRVQGE